MKPSQSDLQRILLEGIDHHEGGRLKKAEAAFGRALKIDPGQPIALYLNGRVAHDTGRFEDAVKLLAKSLARRADHVEAHFFHGEALAALGRHQDAKTAYQSALAINANFPQGHRRLGDTLLKLNQVQEAITSIHRALAIDANAAASHLSLGMAQEALGELDGALKSYARALAIEPALNAAAENHKSLLAKITSAGTQTPAPLSDETELAGKTGDGVIFDEGNLRLRQCRHGRMLYFANDDYIGQALDLYGEFSEAEAALFRQIVKPGMTVIDVGANIGVHTVSLAHAVLPGGGVIALEPQRIIFQMLCANVANNGLGNVRCFHAASGRGGGTLKVPELNYDAGGNFGGLSLVDANWGTSVPVLAIDQLDLETCHFIKIDVEGMETEVIAGAEATIGKFRPILYVENERQEKSASLIQQILDAGYRLFWHMPPLFNPDNFRGEANNVFPNKGSVNMVCVPRETKMSLGGFREILSADEYWK